MLAIISACQATPKMAPTFDCLYNVPHNNNSSLSIHSFVSSTSPQPASKSVGSAHSPDEARSVGRLDAGISLTTGALIDGLQSQRGHDFNRPDLPLV